MCVGYLDGISRQALGAFTLSQAGPLRNGAPVRGGIVSVR
jgi:hypothetical protein